MTLGQTLQMTRSMEINKYVPNLINRTDFS